MTTLQRGICLGCMLVAVAAAIATGLLIDPGHSAAPGPQAAGDATPAETRTADAEPSARAADPASPPARAETPAPSEAAQREPSQAQTQTQTQAQRQAPTNQRAQAARPPVRIEPAVYDFGLKNPNELVWADFTVHNTSSQTLFIREIKPTCKCTVPEPDSEVIPPGGQITIDASVDLRGSLGDVKKDFRIFFEGFAMPVDCTIKGVLSYPVQISPDRPAINAVPRDLTGQLYLRSLEGRPFRVCAVNGREPVVLHKNSRAETATEWRIQYQLPDLTREQLPYMLLVETDHPGARMLDLKLSGTASSKRELEWLKLWKDIFVNRNNVNLGVIPKGSYADFETSIMRPDRTGPCEVSLESRMFDDLTPIPSAARDGELSVEIINVEPIDGRPNDEMYTVRVTNHSDENKVIQQPVYFHSGDVESRLWIGARLVPTPDAAPCGVD